LLGALHDPKLNARLTALQTLDQINQVRAKLLQTLQESSNNKPGKREDVFKEFQAPDPLGPIVARDWKRVADLLKEDDPRLRRGAVEFFEQLKDEATPALPAIAHALEDRDRFVRWAAARTVRLLPSKDLQPQTFVALGKLLLDADLDLGAAAALAIEKHGSAIRKLEPTFANAGAAARKDVIKNLSIVIANGVGTQYAIRGFDGETRIAALKALAAIGGAPAQEAFPATLLALPDRDVRVRREAAATIGALGRPRSPELVQPLLDALRKALRDDDPEVRLNASETILNILK